MSFVDERLAHPEWALGCLAVCAAALVAIAAARLRARRRRARLLPRVGPGLSLTRDAALVAALAATLLALLGPRFGERTVRTTASGIDLVVLVDVSRSMDARDVPPSRLDRARRAARDVLARLSPRDRVALAAFAGRGVLFTPLTPDREVVAELLSALDTDLFDPPGSDAGAGVRAALGAFEAGSERPRLLLLLGDGEDPLHRSDLGSAEARRAEVRVVAVAFGSDAGSTLEVDGRLLTDASGALVVSRRRSDRLERLAASTGGEVFRADRWGDFDVGAAVTSLRRDAGRVPGETVERRVRATQVLPFALLAFALLGVEGLRGRPARSGARRSGAPSRGGAGGSRWLRRTVLPCVLSALLVSGGQHGGAAAPSDDDEAIEQRVRAEPGDAALLLELGLARLERGRHASAERAFFAAAVAGNDPKLSALAYYDLGVSALERGDLESARDAFFDALALDPSDREARFNLEWTLAALPPATAPRAQPGKQPPAEPEKQRPAEPEKQRPAEPEKQPQAEPEERPEPPRRADAPEPTREADAPPPAPLDPMRARRWLDRVQDDPARALRAAARAGAAPRRSGGPAW